MSFDDGFWRGWFWGGAIGLGPLRGLRLLVGPVTVLRWFLDLTFLGAGASALGGGLGWLTLQIMSAL